MPSAPACIKARAPSARNTATCSNVAERNTTRAISIPRPGLLLIPWAISDTATDKQAAATGEDAKALAAEKPGAAAPPAPAAAKAKKDAAPAGQWTRIFPSRRAGIVAFNLKPDKNGNVAFDAASLGDRQFIQVVAVDSDSASTRHYIVAEKQLTLRDLRLADDSTRSSTSADKTA